MSETYPSRQEPWQDQITNAAAAIADFDLPADYSPEFSASLDGFTFVSYNLGDNHSHLYLIQSEKKSDGEKLASAVEQIAPGSYDPQTRMTIIEAARFIITETLFNTHAATLFPVSSGMQRMVFLVSY